MTPDLGQQLLVLTPADDETRERLDLLRVLGTQDFTAGVRATHGSAGPEPGIPAHDRCR